MMPIHSSCPGSVAGRTIFGIGHLIMAPVFGAKTYKMKLGNRGANHPVKDQTTGKIEITSHNHGYAVAADSLSDEAEATHVNG